jgi:hypothetical protein
MWTIENKIFGEETNLLTNALKSNNIKYRLLENPEEDVPIETFENNVCRGSIEFVENYKCYTKRLTLENYDYTKYSQYFKGLLLNEDYIVLPWWRLYNYQDIIFQAFPEAENFFIRPNSGRKIFTGTTLSKKWWIRELDIIRGLPSSNINHEDLVIISTKKQIEAECRVLLYKNEIIDFDYYEGKQERGDLNFIESFAKKCKYFPDNFYIMDIAFFGNCAKIVELNNLFTAGWYNVDYNKTVRKINEYICS